MLANNLTLDEEDAVQAELLELQAAVVCTNALVPSFVLILELAGGNRTSERRRVALSSNHRTCSRARPRGSSTSQGSSKSRGTGVDLSYDHFITDVINVQL